MSNLLPVLVGVVAVVVGIAFSVGLHEVGHMMPAKAFGVRVSQYMIGFGPTIWSRRRGETEYGLKVFPIGGYVRMVGMLPGAKPGTEVGKGFFGQLVGDARNDSVAEIEPGEEPRAFYNLSAPKKCVVMLGGPTMNLVLAFVFTAISFLVGVTQATPTVASVSECVPTPDGSPCDPADLSPAAAAGFQVGDRILEYDGVQITTWTRLLDAIDGTELDRPNQGVAVVVDRGGQPINLTVHPINATRAILGPDGEVADTISGPFLGLGPTFARQSMPLSEVPSTVWQMFAGTARMVLRFPVEVVRAVAPMFTGAERSADGVMSVVGVGRVAADVAGADQVSVLDRVAVMISLLASLNMALFVFNLIPLLPLDGGHVINAVFEGARRTLARIRGRVPLPGPADVARMLPLSYLMTMLLLGSGLLLIMADVIDPISIFG